MGIAQRVRDLIDATNIKLQAAKILLVRRTGCGAIAYEAWGAVSMNPEGVGLKKKDPAALSQRGPHSKALNLFRNRNSLW